MGIFGVEMMGVVVRRSGMRVVEAPCYEICLQ